MFRFHHSLAFAVSLLFCSSLLGQGTTSGATASCNFDSNKQIAVEYQRMTVNAQKVRVWARRSPITRLGHRAASR